MRAAYPEVEGRVAGAGVEIRYEVYGSGDTTLFLVPPAPITHSRIWKALIPNLARRYRVVTFDPRGNGGSGRPTEPSDHGSGPNLADMQAVLDAAEVESAVVVSHCHAGWWATRLASEHPSRVQALILISPGVPYLGRSHQHWIDAGPMWDDVVDDATSWGLYNRHAITNRHRDWLEFFFGSQLVEPHSTKQFEDAVAWGLESTGEVLAAAEEGFDADIPERAVVEQMVRSLSMPALVIHGERDICQHVDRGRAFAELAGGEILVIEDGGHLSPAREPVKVNRAITDFVDRRVAP